MAGNKTLRRDAHSTKPQRAGMMSMSCPAALHRPASGEYRAGRLAAHTLHDAALLRAPVRRSVRRVHTEMRCVPSRPRRSRPREACGLMEADALGASGEIEIQLSLGASSVVDAGFVFGKVLGVAVNHSIVFCKDLPSLIVWRGRQSVRLVIRVLSPQRRLTRFYRSQAFGVGDFVHPASHKSGNHSERVGLSKSRCLWLCFISRPHLLRSR